MRSGYEPEYERLLDRARQLLGGGDDRELVEANTIVNQALQLRPDAVDAWLIKAQIASATGDDLAALAAIEMAARRAPQRPECLYWRGAVLGDLGRHREALRAIEAAFHALPEPASDGDGEAHWLLEDLYYEKITILLALGLHDAAVVTCDHALTRCPSSALLRTAIPATARPRLKVLRGGRP